jgi:hypothetical protein
VDGGKSSCWRTPQDDLKGSLQHWTDIPPVVSVTFVVSRKAVAMFDDRIKSNRNPICELIVQSTNSRSPTTYTDVQLGFGTLETSGEPFTNDFAVSVREDPKGWNGSSPLMVSAQVSTRVLMEGGSTTSKVIF